MSDGEWPAVGVMIDRPGVADRDDALWVRRDGPHWRARIYIADVARVVSLGSASDLAACRRTRTIYLPDRTLPMLAAAEQAAAALRPGHPAPVCVIEVAVTATGELVDTTVTRATLAEPEALSYEQAAAALTDPAHRWHGMLTQAYELARTLLARRRAAGALAAYDLRHGWATDEDGRIVDLGSVERNAGYIIVQELMIAANEAVARWAVARELPILFRNHRAGPAVRQELTDQLAVAAGPEGAVRWDTVAQHLAMVLRPAVYEPRVGGHFGLNLPAYTHATSPLRRYPDLVTQRVLVAAAEGRPSPYRLETLAETAAAVNLRQEAHRTRRAATLRAAARAVTRAQLTEPDYRHLDDNTFGKLVRLAVDEQRFQPALAAEVERRLAADRLLAREAATVLLGGRNSDDWAPVRQRLLDWLACHPANAVSTLSLFAQWRYGGEVDWREEPVGDATRPMFRVAARLAEHESPPRCAPSKRAARQQAALGLVAQLAGLPDPSGDLAPPAAPPARVREVPPGHPPVMAINEWKQLGRLVDLRWDYERDGAAHEPTHTCVVSARDAVSGHPVSATGTGGSKTAAKHAAAARLWARLSSDSSAGT